MDPLVSVIIPTYNRGGYIAEAISSVFAQTYSRWEIIVVDDGSTDDTQEILAPFGGRIKLLRQENKGVSAARNRGLREAKGELVAFLDSDDSWKPNKLELQVPWFRKPHIGLVCSDLEMIGDDGSPVANAPVLSWIHHRDHFFNLLMKNFILSSSVVMIRRSILEEAGVFDESLSMAEDYDLWLRIAEKSEVMVLPEKLAVYRLHQGYRLSHQRRDVAFSSMIAALDKAGKRKPDWVGTIRPAYQRRLGVYCYDLACVYYRNQDYSNSFKLFGRGIALNPFQFKAYVFAVSSLIKSIGWAKPRGFERLPEAGS